MEFEAISATRIIVLMSIGALFAFAGLYMMLRPRPEGAAKVELFGLKFESSSAGLLVFIIGAAFLAVTLFVPERKSGASDNEPPTAEAPAEPQEPKTTTPPKTIAEGALITEKEPNNGIRDAQPLAIGQVVAGKFGGNSGEDWYSVAFPDGDIAQHELKLRHVHGNNVTATLYDLREKQIGRVTTRSGAEYVSLEDQTTGKIFIKTSGAVGGWETDTYEVSIQPK